jgi:hypothetical protein
MNNQVIVQPTRRDSIGCTGAQHAEIIAFAEARGLQKELFHVVVAEWKRSKLH